MLVVSTTAGVTAMKRLVLPLVLSWCLAAEAVAAETPLANAGRKGLQAKTIDEMLALPDEEIDIGLGALLIPNEYHPGPRGCAHDKHWRGILLSAHNVQPEVCAPGPAEG